MSAPIWPAVAWRASTAVSGSAIAVIWSPSERHGLAEEEAAEACVLAKQRWKRGPAHRASQSAPSVDGHGYGGVEERAHPAREIVGGERLGQQDDVRVEHAVVAERVVSVYPDM